MNEVLRLKPFVIFYFLIQHVSPFAPKLTGTALVSTEEFPFHMVVNQSEIKKALILAAVNPRINGVLIAGGHGTGKSVMARAMHKLLPETIDRVKGSAYNIDPTGGGGMDSLLLDEIACGRKSLDTLEVEQIALPLVQVPLGVMEDSLVGTIDIEKSIQSGETIFAPGLLAKAHRGVLLIDDVNLLDDDIMNILFDVISDGWVTVEREGVSVRYPCRALVIATWNPAEGDITKHLTDRVAISLSADAGSPSIKQRVETVNNVICFSGDAQEAEQSQCQSKVLTSIKEDELLRKNIISAYQLVSKVHINKEQMLYLCEEATRAGCEGQRAEIFATELAIANAAMNGRLLINEEDLKVAVRLAIAPRSMFFSEDMESVEDEEGTVQDYDREDIVSLPPPPKESSSESVKEQPKELEQNIIDEQDQEMSPDLENEIEISIPEQFMFGIDMVPLDPDLLKFALFTKRGKGGKSSRIYNLDRGRYVKPVFPGSGQKGKIAVGATLRAAAPYQKLRKIISKKRGKEKRMVYIDKNDWRFKRMARKSGALVIFVVDASGSMALNRMDAAKGAAISLLSEAYKARDKICLISFHDTQAEVLVPPTKSIALTKRRLEGMSCGGGSPLAHALTLAAKVGSNEKKIKKDVGRVIVVVLTDGRANVPMSVSLGTFDFDGRPTKEFLREEAIKCATSLRLMDFNVVVIDTEDKFVGTGIAQEIATTTLGRYYQIDPRDTEAIKAVSKAEHSF